MKRKATIRKSRKVRAGKRKPGSLHRLVRHWKMERLRWLRAKKQPFHGDTFKDHAQCYADVYARCAKELKEHIERMPNDKVSDRATP